MCIYGKDSGKLYCGIAPIYKYPANIYSSGQRISENHVCTVYALNVPLYHEMHGKNGENTEILKTRRQTTEKITGNMGFIVMYKIVYKNKKLTKDKTYL